MEKEAEELNDVRHSSLRPALVINHCDDDDAAGQKSNARPSAQAVSVLEERAISEDDTCANRATVSSLLFGDQGVDDYVLSGSEVSALEGPEAADQASMEKCFNVTGASAAASLRESPSEAQPSSRQKLGNSASIQTAEAEGQEVDQGPPKEYSQESVRVKEEFQDYFTAHPKLNAPTYPIPAHSHPEDQTFDDGPPALLATYDPGANLSGKLLSFRQKAADSRHCGNPWEALAYPGQPRGKLEATNSKPSLKRVASDDIGLDSKVRKVSRSTELAPNAHSGHTQIPQAQISSSLTEIYPPLDEFDRFEPVTQQVAAWQSVSSPYSGFDAGFAPDQASVYPDPSRHVLFSPTKPAEQTQSLYPLFNPSCGQERDSDSGNSFQGQELHVGNDQPDNDRRPLSHQDWSSLSVLTSSHEEPASGQGGQTSSSQPTVNHFTQHAPRHPFPDMSRPGPGGPGTWPGDWVELSKDRDKYPGFFWAKKKIPGGHPLNMYCYWFPNHVFGRGLDPFIDQGWGGRKIWEHYHPDTRAACAKDNGNLVGRPWNFLQQAISRRRKERCAENFHANEGNEPSEWSERAGRLEWHRQPQLERSKVRTTSQVQPIPAYGAQPQQTRRLMQQASPRLPIASAIPLQTVASYGNTNNISSFVAPKTIPGEPWWHGSLRDQARRLQQLRWQSDADFENLSQEARWISASNSVLHHCIKFIERYWPGNAQELRSMRHLMNFLRDIYHHLSQGGQTLWTSDEGQFCETWMQSYLIELNTAVDVLEQNIWGSSAVLLQAVGDEFTSGQEVVHGLSPPWRGSLARAEEVNSENLSRLGVIRADHRRGDQVSTTRTFPSKRGHRVRRHAHIGGIMLQQIVNPEALQSFRQAGTEDSMLNQPFSGTYLRNTRSGNSRQDHDPGKGFPLENRPGGSNTRQRARKPR